MQFSPTNASLNHFETPVGSTVNVDVYAAQNGISTDLTTFGLISMGFAVTYDPTKIDLVGIKFAFSGSFPSNHEFLENSGKLQVYGDVGGGNPQGFKGNPILLGTLSLQTKVTGNFNIVFGDFDPAVSSLKEFVLQVNAPDTDLDKVLFGDNLLGTYQFSVGQIAAVPEPGSILLLSTVGIALGGWYRVRRKKRGGSAVCV